MDRTTVYVSTIVCLTIALIAILIYWNGAIDQKAYLERKERCSQSGGVFLENAQMQGCVRISPVEQ